MAVNPPFVNLNLNETLEDTFLAGATLAAYQRVTLTTTGTILAANATDASFGVTKQPIANGSYGVVRLDAPQQYGLANTLINVADTVYAANTGWVSATLVNNAQLGVALTAAPTPGANNANLQTPIVILQVKKSSV